MVYFVVFFVLTNSVRFHPFYAKITYFTTISFIRPRTSVCRLRPSSVGDGRAVRNQGGGWDVRFGKKRNNFSWVGMKIFWHAIYFANPNPEPDYQYLSLS